MSARSSEVRRAAPRPAQQPEHPPLTVVRRQPARAPMPADSRRLAKLLIVGAIGVTIIIFTVVLEQVVLAQSAFHLTKIRAELSAAESQHQELLVEATRLENPTRIESYARARLGMIDPPYVDYLVARISQESDERPARHGAAGPLPSTGRAAASGAPYDWRSP
jgi:cell division protein FtsL